MPVRDMCVCRFEGTPKMVVWGTLKRRTRIAKLSPRHEGQDLIHHLAADSHIRGIPLQVNV